MIDNQRMLDLLRVCRSQLFVEEHLIDEDEYAWLASLPSAATHKRLADYDALRMRERALLEAREVLVSLAPFVAVLGRSERVSPEARAELLAWEPKLLAVLLATKR
jgi:hypothetical protein